MRWNWCAAMLAALSGCHAFYMDVDGRIAQRADQAVDVLPSSSAPRTLPGFEEQSADGPMRARIGAPQAVGDSGEPVAVQNEEQPLEKAPKKYKDMLDRLKFKEDILGFAVPDLAMPGPKAGDKAWEESIKKQFPPLPALPKLPPAQKTPEGNSYSLAELQQIALRTNPTIKQAHLDVESARGLALQAGLWPNPNIGYEADTIGQGSATGSRTAGQQGGFVEQTLVTMGKRSLARNAALRDVQIAEQALRKTESDVQSQVRSGYFGVLAAQENHRMTKGLTELTDELYNVLIIQLRAGQVAPYEPMQIRVLSLQSRQTLVQAQNRYVSAWRQLAATLGTPQAPLAEVEGKIDMPVPHFDHDKTLAYIIEHHTDIVSAKLGVEKNRFLVRLAEVQPYPDVTAHVAVQKDYTTAPYGTVANVNLTLPFPLFDRNQGNIQSARSLLRKALEDLGAHRIDLTQRTADAFERYDNNRKLLKTYKYDILPGQVQAFRAALVRHAFVADPNISYNDVVTSQQTLVNLIGTYLQALSDQWTAVSDIGNLLQTKDIFQTQEWDEVAPVPDVPAIMRHDLRHGR